MITRLVFSAVVLSAAITGCDRAYDCALAEISPDMPVSAKEACRAARAKQ